MPESKWIPEPSEASQPFFDGVTAGKLRLQVCSECKTWHYPVIRICSACGSNTIEWRDTKGKGTVYSHSRLQRVTHPRHEGRLPIIVAQVDIDEGLRLFTNLIGTQPEDVRVGDSVEIDFEALPDGGLLPVFRITSQ
jgi:hypothetical protein